MTKLKGGIVTMVRYKCNKCGHEIDELPIRTVYEFELGRYWVNYEYDDVCSCGGDYREISQCDICGKWLYSDENYYGYCKECYEEYG